MAFRAIDSDKLAGLLLAKSLYFVFKLIILKYQIKRFGGLSLKVLNFVLAIKPLLFLYIVPVAQLC